MIMYVYVCTYSRNKNAPHGSVCAVFVPVTFLYSHTVPYQETGQTHKQVKSNQTKFVDQCAMLLQNKNLI